MSIARFAKMTILSLTLVGLLIDIGYTVAVRSLHLYFNWSDSIPIGFYRSKPVTRITRGMLVITCYPDAVATLARARHYFRPGECDGLAPLIKLIAAVPGDRVNVGPTSVAVNGIPLPNSKPLARDSLLRPMTRYPIGSYIIAPGTVWLEAPNPRSWDSRYYGPISTSYFRAEAFPVFTVKT